MRFSATAGIKTNQLRRNFSWPDSGRQPFQHSKSPKESSAIYGDEIQVLTKPELIQQERLLNNVSSFGVIFGFGTIMGLLVGGVVVYQVLYTDVSDHLKEYATLKAMGFSSQFILIVVIQGSSFGSFSIHSCDPCQRGALCRLERCLRH